MNRTARRALLLGGAAAALLASVRLARGRFATIEVAGSSMLPTLEPGDFLLVRRGGLPADPAGLVTLLRGPGDRPMLKRVVGLPGESLRVGGHVEVNGRTLLEPYVQGAAPPATYRGVHRLEADRFFVLGDHRAASTDSRDFGAVHSEAFEGVAVWRYWPPGRLGPIARGRRTFAPSAPAPDVHAEALA